MITEGEGEWRGGYLDMRNSCPTQRPLIDFLVKSISLPCIGISKVVVIEWSRGRDLSGAILAWRLLVKLKSRNPHMTEN